MLISMYRGMTVAPKPKPARVTATIAGPMQATVSAPATTISDERAVRRQNDFMFIPNYVSAFPAAHRVSALGSLVVSDDFMLPLPPKPHEDFPALPWRSNDLPNVRELQRMTGLGHFG
jgi:hypothetical protein